MKHPLLLFFVFSFGLIALPAKSDPAGATAPMADDNASPWAAPTNKEHSLSKDVPVGDFDAVKSGHLEPPIQSSQRVAGHLMHAKKAKQTAENKNVNLPVGKIITSPKPGAPLIKSYKLRKKTNGFTPRVGDFGLRPQTVPNTKVAQ